MYSGQVVFAQLMEFLPRHEFNTCVRRYRGDYRVRDFSCRDQFLAMAFAQLTYRESLRDIETCLRALESKLYHAGFRGKISRSTLGDANKRRDWHIWADVAQVLIRRARTLYAKDDFGLTLKHAAYALDSTTIDLCLALFPWARFRRRKGAVKTQVWIAVSVYVLVAILKKELKLDRSLTEILQILSVTPFEKPPIFQALSTSVVPNSETPCCNQLSLFDL